MIHIMFNSHDDEFVSHNLRLKMKITFDVIIHCMLITKILDKRLSQGQCAIISGLILVNHNQVIR